MKKYVLVIITLIIALISNAQNANTIDSVVSVNAFINLPLQPHKKSVDIFFNCDKPKQPYYNIKVVDVQGGNSYQDLLNKIQETARNEGFDGLIILGKSNYLTQDNSVSSAIISGLAQGTTSSITGKLSSNNHNSYNSVYTPTINSVNVLSAIGLKYKSRMQYVDRIVKRAIMRYKDLLTIDTINFTLNSEIISNNASAVNAYEDKIRMFELCDYYSTHKMPEIATINYNEGEYSTTIKVENQYGNIKYKLQYTSDSVLYKVQIRIPSSDAEADAKIYDVVYDFNKDKTINKRFVRQGRKAGSVFTDSYQYDAEKRCIGFTRYDEIAKTISLQVNFAYFTMNDLPTIL